MKVPEEQLEAEMLGYVKYKKRVWDSNYSKIMLQSIYDHRNAIIEKYKDAENKHIDNILGMCIADGFLIPVDFDGTLIDKDDVFAAVYSYDIDFTIHKDARDKFILWQLFTNDPYIPAIPMVYIQRVNVGELIFRKKRNDFLPEVEKMFPNLKYPVTTLNEFEKTIQSEYTVRGKLEKEFVLGQIYDAKNRVGLYEPMTITYELGGYSRGILNKYGYQV